jgi:predicted ATPase
MAQVVEARFPELCETQPELVAQHYTAAGCAEQAVHYWQRAGQHASERSANLEAISHVTTGIELLTTLPERPARTQHTVTLHIALGAALQMAKGHAAPEVEQAYTQARVLSQQVGETPELVSVLLGLWRFYMVRPQLHTARELGETVLRLAQQTHDPALSVVAHYALGVTWFSLGALLAARQHLDEGSARDTPEQRRALVFRMGHDPGVGCRAHAARTLWLLGYPDQALAHLHGALALAHELSHPYSLAYARSMAAVVSQFRRDVPAAHEQAGACVELATAQGFPQWAALGTSVRGWALALQGQGEAGMAQVRQGIAAWQATGAALTVPYVCTVLADVSAHLGHIEDGLQALAEAHTLVEQHDERWWEAEVSRLRGVLLLKQTGTPQGLKFCNECGVPLRMPCAQCGFANQPQAKFCGECGAALLPQAGASTALPVAPRPQAPLRYTPAHLAETILTTRGALEGERKQVTVLFTDLKGSMELLADRDPEEAQQLLDPVLERMIEAVHRYEGTVNQVMGDGIMALFGAPIAHEDHAVRACHAALAMQGSVQQYAAEV